MKIAGLDLETTGVETDTDVIVEVCVSIRDTANNFAVVDEFHTLVNPGRPIPPETTEIHGITDAMVADKPKFPEVAGRIQAMLDGCAVGGHNVEFDISILGRMLRECGLAGVPVGTPTFDTMHVERRVNGHKLEAMYKRYTGKALDDAHSANVDVQAYFDVLRAQISRHPDLLPDGLQSCEFNALRTLNGEEVFEYLDVEKKFARRSDGTVIFTFGKNKGKSVKENLSYVDWMLRGTFGEDTKAVALKLLADNGRGAGPAVEVSPLARKPWLRA